MLNLSFADSKLFLQQGDNAEKVEYRVWNPFRSKLAAAILGGIDQIHMPPGSKVLYLGAASGTTVSHVADVVGPVKYLMVLFYHISDGEKIRHTLEPSSRIFTYLVSKLCYSNFSTGLFDNLQRHDKLL